MNRNTHTTVELPFPAEAVYQALTGESSVKRWLTPCARVDLSAGIFELWGPNLPEAPPAPVTRLLESRHNELLRFAWQVRGGNGTVAFELIPRRGSTHMSIRCDLPPTTAGAAGAHDFFSTAVENLRRLLAGGSAPYFPYYGPRPEGDPTLAIDIETSPERVYDALINPAQLNRYIAPAATVEPHVGGRYDYGWKGGGPRKILEIEPGRKLSFNWSYSHEGEPESETVVTWTLEGSGGRTRLTLVHSGFAKGRPADDYRTGWMKYLNEIKSMLELGVLWTPVKLEGPQGDY